MKRIITRQVINAFYYKHPETKDALESWYVTAKRSEWRSPNDVKAIYPNASILGDNRVVFNIKGNEYRLIVHIKYGFSTIFIKWFGTHAEYDKIDALIIGR